MFGKSGVFLDLGSLINKAMFQLLRVFYVLKSVDFFYMIITQKPEHMLFMFVLYSDVND